MAEEQQQIPIADICKLENGFAPKYTQEQDKITKICSNFAHKRCWKSDNECMYYHIQEVKDAHDLWAT